MDMTTRERAAFQLWLESCALESPTLFDAWSARAAQQAAPADTQPIAWIDRSDLEAFKESACGQTTLYHVRQELRDGTPEDQVPIYTLPPVAPSTQAAPAQQEPR